MKIKIDSDDDLPLEGFNVAILIHSIFNKKSQPAFL